VPTEDAVSEATGCEVVCVLIGERPGLITAESMSAYLAYKATVNMPEARRTVVSNIHRGGTPAVEAGSYVAEIIEKMLELKTSGVDLKL
jgi:ethanolamine ammonia-lyase small subunit